MFSIFAATVMLFGASAVSMSGKVIDQDDQPMANVVVVIQTARPRSGPAMMCPSCYPDCAKRFVTKADGKFQFDDLSDKLLLSLVAGATGYQGSATPHYDPLLEDEITIKLVKQLQSKNEFTFAGKVVDPNGRPISGSHVSIEEVLLDNGHGFGGARDKITPLTISDENGEFKLIANEPLKRVRARLLTPRYAPEDLTWSASDKRELIATLGPGASLCGRLFYQGKPLSETMIGIVQENRLVGNIVTPMDVSTDHEGRFLFEHIPPNHDYTIYTQTGQNARGVLPVSLVTIPAHGKLVDLGDLEANEPQKLTIVVRTEDGSPIPDKSGVFIGRQDAWDGKTLTLENQSESTVSLVDVGRELFFVSMKTPKYNVVRSEPLIQPDLNRRYPIRIEKDCTLTIIIAPSK